ncbi:unnamed protein product [Bursaphelenchus xylophilus]|uniref:(pine wood nematode) hypothetical protein n=1 Tax=Bursaphelenchus xylophilus TaxID=6326 RepID=A0A1I7SAT0_BURXY|nr:unnamed protein product [Bursaphelenchus xylophilus]CAG9126801.1 unnamed protein product [Bursaphelenchus xylophilus]
MFRGRPNQLLCPVINGLDIKWAKDLNGSQEFYPILLTRKALIRRKFEFEMRYFAILIVLANVLAIVNANCEFTMDYIPEYSNIIRTDNEGRSCRGNISLPFCRGACKTSEEGVHVFPYRESTSHVCVLVGTAERDVNLTDCDTGADPSVAYVTISAATECECRELEPRP